MNTTINSRILRQFKAGNFIFKEGDAGSSMYIIKTGKVEVSTLKNNRKIVLATLSAGSIFGEMALIDQPYRSASVMALTDVSCLEINQLLFDANIEKIPGWLKSFFQILVERLRESNKRIDPFGAREKSRQIVLVLNELLKNREFQSTVIPKLSWTATVAKLAVILNIPAEFVNKVMTHLSGMPMVSREDDFSRGRLFVVNNIEQFSQFADYCRMQLESGIDTEKSDKSTSMSGRVKKFLNFIDKLISEQGGGTDLEIHYLESRCQELLDESLDQFQDSKRQLINDKVISVRKTADGDCYYDIDKERMRELVGFEQQQDSFQHWGQIIGRE